MQIDSHATRAMQETARGKRTRGPWARLLDSLIGLAGGHAELLSHAERPWTSATFSGTRHTAAFTFTGAEAVEAAEHFIALLPDHEFAIPGQLVADAAVIEARLDMLPVPTFVIEVDLLLLDEV
ncbi:hypothetical protein [Novosphingobium aquae]|uniref:Uncharacterized protein n=1 Tax=Novosphingobium aquae TaxID=3133435 RepID=A0ABU8S3Q6_9SPHN